MNRSCHARWWPALFAAVQFFILPLSAEDSTNVPATVKLFSAPAVIMPPLPQSPVGFFRRLLAMSPGDRENFLTNKPPEVRERLLAKIQEYQALGADERELRLRATELRWYLMPLLRDAPTNRAVRLSQAPDDIRDLVKARLMQWEILPPTLQKEFLDNERTLHYFSHVDATNAAPDSEQARWNALPENQRQTVTAQFNQFFELTPMEKQKALGTLSETEREQMEKTLQSFDKLPPAQRVECIRAYSKFAGMTPQARVEFLKNAERWSQMSPAERKAWGDLAAHVPQWPPLPTALIMPPMPPVPKNLYPTVATNHG
jgi:hypothetical protein